MIEIQNIITEILYHRFSDPEKQQLGKIIGNRINFACPYCGDSQESSDKKRGNIYLNSKTFKCFNDGCPKNFCSLSEFISYWCQKYNIDVTEIDAEDLEPEVESFDTDQALNTLRTEIINDKLIDTEVLINRFNLLDIDQAPQGTLAYQHAYSRNLFDIPQVNKFIKIDRSYDKFFIINRDLKTNKLVGIYIRYLKSNAKLRYKMIKYGEILTAFGLENNLSESELDMINYAGSYFNITNIDFNQSNIKVVEGQFDSLFLLNSIGVSGVSKSMNLIDYLNQYTKCHIIVDEDQSEMINKLLYQNYYTILWGYLKQKIQTNFNMSPHHLKIINQSIDINDLYSILKYYRSYLNVVKFDKLINKFISNQEVDIILV